MHILQKLQRNGFLIINTVVSRRQGLLPTNVLFFILLVRIVALVFHCVEAGLPGRLPFSVVLLWSRHSDVECLALHPRILVFEIMVHLPVIPVTAVALSVSIKGTLNRSISPNVLCARALAFGAPLD